MGIYDTHFNTGKDNDYFKKRRDMEIKIRISINLFFAAN